MGASRELAELASVTTVSGGNVGFSTSSPSAPLDVNGNVAITGSARRITGDFSNATASNRVMFQTSTANSLTAIGVLPSGTGDSSYISFSNSSTPDNAAYAFVGVAGTTEFRIEATKIGTGTYLPMTFCTGGLESMRIQTSGRVGIGTNAPGQRLTISDANSSNQLAVGGSQQNGMQFLNAAGGSGFIIGRSITVNDANNFFIYDAAAAVTRIVIDSSGSTQFLNGNVMPHQGAPTSKAAAATITGAELVTGILNTTGTTYTITLPTGANIEAAQNWWGVNTCLDWFVINTASGTITIAANGNTTLGGLTIATGTSAHFRIRRTATNTFTVYRL